VVHEGYIAYIFLYIVTKEGKYRLGQPRTGSIRDHGVHIGCMENI
jgi:hypothetical protein